MRQNHEKSCKSQDQRNHHSSSGNQNTETSQETAQMISVPPVTDVPTSPRRTHSHLPCATATVASSLSPSKSLWQNQNQNPAIKDGDQNKDRVENQETVYEIAGIQYPDAETTLILFCLAP